MYSIGEFERLHNTKIVVINKDDEKTDEEELVEDILKIIYKNHINKKIIKEFEK